MTAFHNFKEKNKMNEADFREYACREFLKYQYNKQKRHCAINLKENISSFNRNRIPWRPGASL